MKQKNSITLLLLLFIATLAFHLYLLLQYRTSDIEPPKEPQQAQAKKQGSGEEDGKTSIWVSPGIIPCDSYDGIGVQFNAITGIVSNVADNSPANKAGIKVGDELITPLWNMDLMFGQKIDVIIVRDNKKLTLPVIVDRICHQ